MDTRTRLLKLLNIVVRNLALNSDKLNINGTLQELFEQISATLYNNNKVAISEVEKNVRSSLARTISTLLEWDRRDDSLPDIDFLLTDLESSMRGDIDYYETVENSLQGIYESDAAPDHSQKIVQSDLTMLSQDIRGTDLSMRMFKMSNDLNGMVAKGDNIGLMLSEFLKEIETETQNLIGNGKEDLISYMDSDDPDSVDKVVDEVFAKEDGGAILQFGFQRLNTALQKGIRLGQFMGISALQHRNKTGLSLNLFRHLATFNAPVIRKEGKIPCLIRWSFEDDLSDNYQYLFKDVMNDSGEEPIPMSEASKSMVKDTVMDNLTSRGWKIIMVKANPSEWNCMKMQSFVNGLINEGLDPQVFMCDYLLKMPTVGCDRHGPTGTDYRDLVRRTRNYFNKIGCAFITPFQLNTQAKQMLSDGVRDTDFLDTIAGGGFTANSKQIDQELDISLLMHIVKNGDEYHQHLVIDKHRLPEYIDENLKRFYLPFPPNFMPLKSDVDKEITGCTRLKTTMDDMLEV